MRAVNNIQEYCGPRGRARKWLTSKDLQSPNKLPISLDNSASVWHNVLMFEIHVIRRKGNILTMRCECRTLDHPCLWHWDFDTFYFRVIRQS